MVAPSRNIRVSPSGPFANGQTDPFLQYAGNIYQSQNSSDLTQNTIFEIVADDGSGSPDTSPKRIAIEGAPSSATPEAVFVPNAANGDLEFEAGTWVVEAELVAGYQTNEPSYGSPGTSAGNLSVDVELVGSSGAVVKTVRVTSTSEIAKQSIYSLSLIHI